MPILAWGRNYNSSKGLNDVMAAVIVTLMLVPQALAYAMLAGLPPYVGLYASMLPLVAYSLFGTSSTLAVGPVAIAALMTASAVAPYSAISLEMGMTAAIVMASISGFILVLAGILRLGFLANFLSHPVITGFISAASIVIASGQLPSLLGFSASGDNLIILGASISNQINHIHLPTVLLSAITLLTLVLSRKYATRWLTSIGLSTFLAQTFTRSIPALLVLIGTILIHLHLDLLSGIKTVGHIPSGLPSIHLPIADLTMWKALLLPALLITIVGYVESISVAENLALKRKEHIDPDQELIALGAANLAACVSSGLPVTGGVSRSVVNSDAGAVTPAAGFFTAIGMAFATVIVAGLLSELPKFVLAATITVAVLSLFDISAFSKIWRHSRYDFVAFIMTFLLTLFVNVESGITAGVVLSIGIHLYRSSRPHTALVGQIAGTEHFKNIDRHDVYVCPNVVTLRIDESLYFANARFLENRIINLIADNKQIKHLVLMFSAVNTIDTSAVETLRSINEQLSELNIGFHLSEVKGPVMDHLLRTDFLQDLNGEVFMTQFMAYKKLSCLS